MSEPCDWLAILDSAVVSVLRANWCRLGMRFGGGTNANTQYEYEWFLRWSSCMPIRRGVQRLGAASAEVSNFISTRLPKSGADFF